MKHDICNRILIQTKTFICLKNIVLLCSTEELLVLFLVFFFDENQEDHFTPFFNKFALLLFLKNIFTKSSLHRHLLNPDRVHEDEREKTCGCISNDVRGLRSHKVDVEADVNACSNITLTLGGVQK